MRRHGLRKLIMDGASPACAWVSSTSAVRGEMSSSCPKSAPPQNVYDALEPVLIEKEKAEEHLKNIAKEKGIDFVIVRPGGLKSEPRTNTAVLTENTNVCGAIHREDVAALTMMCVLKDKANGKVLSAVDKAQLFDQPEFEVFEVGDGPLSPTQEATENALK